MVTTKDPDKKRTQRVSNKNIERIERLGKMRTEDSFDDVLTRVLDECEKKKKGKE
jgi:hypothetical protein